MKISKKEISIDELTLINSIENNKDLFKMYFKMFKLHFKNFIKDYFKYLFTYNKLYLFNKTCKYLLIILAILIPYIYYKYYPNIILIKHKNDIKYVYEHDSTRTQSNFLKKIAFYESGGSYSPKGNESYHGKYQIGRDALCSIGFNGITKEDFINDHELQEIAMKRLMKYNKKIMIEWIGKYEGKTINNIYITQSGILAACHLGGPGNVITFLKSNGNIIFKDGNGTPISKYLKELAGYRLNF